MPESDIKDLRIILEGRIATSFVTEKFHLENQVKSYTATMTLLGKWLFDNCSYPAYIQHHIIHKEFFIDDDMIMNFVNKQLIDKSTLRYFYVITFKSLEDLCIFQLTL